MAGTMSFASITDAVVVAMDQYSTQTCAFIVENFFLKIVTLLLKCSEYFANISSLFITGMFPATVLWSYG
jgi:hypothetical protein